ncbi:hypothetical protein DFH28DRAFT_893045 [Melampsora americana]|nr:hypothetical protein DFH28DRAFT_893045 [Melampsora americana]
MADHIPKYLYPIKSVVLPKRLHIFLGFQHADLVLHATTSEYLQLIDVFYPKLCLPSDLEVDMVIRIFELMVLPFLRRQESFDKDTCTLSFIAAKVHLAHELPHPTESLVLPQNLIKFIGFHDDPEMVVDTTPEEYHEIIDLFFPKLNLSQCFTLETLIDIFNILVRPYFLRLEDWDEDSGHICYLTAEILSPIEPEKIPPIQTVTLPPSLRSFLAFVDPKVLVFAGPTTEHIIQIIKLFHPGLESFFDLKGTDSIAKVLPIFNTMVLPYLCSVFSFDSQNNELSYYAIDL